MNPGNENTAVLSKLVSHILERKEAGEDHDVIHSELLEQGIPENELAEAMREADEYYLESLIRPTGNREEADNTKVYAWILIASGVILTVGTWTGVLEMGGYVIVAYGPVLSGLAMLSYAHRKKMTSGTRFKSPFSRWKE